MSKIKRPIGPDTQQPTVTLGGPDEKLAFELFRNMEFLTPEKDEAPRTKGMRTNDAYAQVAAVNNCVILELGSMPGSELDKDWGVLKLHLDTESNELTLYAGMNGKEINVFKFKLFSGEIDFVPYSAFKQFTDSYFSEMLGYINLILKWLEQDIQKSEGKDAPDGKFGMGFDVAARALDKLNTRGDLLNSIIEEYGIQDGMNVAARNEFTGYKANVESFTNRFGEHVRGVLGSIVRGHALEQEE